MQEEIIIKFADDSKTTEDWIDKIINDLKLVGVV